MLEAVNIINTCEYYSRSLYVKELKSKIIFTDVEIIKIFKTSST